MSYFLSLKKDVVRRWWFISFVVSLICIIYYLVATMIEPGIATDKIRGGQQEKDVWILYFTTWVNILVVAVSFALAFLPKVDRNKLIVKNAKNLMVTTSTLIMLVYFAMIFPFALKIADESGRGVISLISTLCAHLILPAFAITAFVIDHLKVKYNEKLVYWKTILMNFVFPFACTVISIIYYFAAGGNRPDAMYAFLDFNNGLLIPLLSIFGSFASFILATSLVIYIQNKKVK